MLSEGARTSVDVVLLKKTFVPSSTWNSLDYRSASMLAFFSLFVFFASTNAVEGVAKMDGQTTKLSGTW